MDYIYSVANDTQNSKVATDAMDAEIKGSSITIAIEAIIINGDVLTISFKASISAAEKIELDGLVASHGGVPLTFLEVVEAENFPIATNKTIDGKILYTKIHGMKEDIAAGESHRFLFTVPYTEIYFQGAEILEDIIGVNNFTIRHPAQVAADDETDPDPANHIYGGHLEKYGYDVNMGVIKYIREAKYAAKIPQGLVLECVVKNDSPVTKEIGVNFIMHDIRDPL